MIVKRNGKYHVLSENGKHLGGPYDSREEAVKRLKQVEHFKKQKEEAINYDDALIEYRKDSEDSISELDVDEKESYDKNGVHMTYAEIIDEHEKLVDALKTKDPKKLRDELEEQGSELEDYKKHAEDSGKKEITLENNHYCFVRGFELKEGIDRELYVDGFIATSHIDAVSDKIPRETLEKWAKELNDGSPAANKVSYHHDRKPKVVGVAVKGSAKVVSLPDKEFGLFTRTHVNKTAEEYKDLVYELQNGMVDGFSIEYNTHDGMTTRKEYAENKEIRVLMPETELSGYGFASRPVQKEAAIVAYSYKEVMNEDSSEDKEQVSDREELRKKKGMSVSEFYAVPRDPPSSSKLPIFDAAHVRNAMARFSQTQGLSSEERAHARSKILHAAKKFGVSTENFDKDKNSKEVTEMSEEEKEANKRLADEDKEKKKKMMHQEPDADDSDEDEKEYEDDADEDAMKKKVAKPKAGKKEAVLSVEMKEAISSAVRNAMPEVKEQVLKQTETKEIPVEVKEFKEIFGGKEVSIQEQFHRAAALVEQKEINLMERSTTSAESREYKSFATNGTRLEYKSLGLTTNQNTDTDYLLSSAELQDVFDPIIYNLLNQKTVTWNILEKDSYAGKGNNLVQFTGKIAANSTAAFYTGNAVNTGNVSRLKFQTKFKKLQVGVSVDGDMIAAARGGPLSDVFAQEVMDSTIDLLSYLNGQLFGTSGAETDSGIIGFEYIANSATYTSLYNLTRSTTNKLAPDSAGDTYINQASAPISMSNLRAAIRQAIKEGADKRNLVFICEHTQGNLLRGKFDSERRFLQPTATEFGFSTDLFIDGVPVFEDKDCNNAKWFLIDKETHRVAIWIPPTIEMLGKVGDSMDAFIKMYLAVYNRAPRRLVEIYGCATS